MARSRTTKTLAKRIELDYFHRPHPLRVWRRRVAWAAVGAAAGLAAWAMLPSRRIVWSGGSLAPSHRVFQADCAACHGARSAGHQASQALSLAGAGAGAGRVTDAACISCHAGPRHQAEQTLDPSCASCHFEHRGESLTEVGDRHCAACHGDLATASGARPAVDDVDRFPTAHPEFDAVAAGRDPSRLRLNHELHLKPGLRGPSGPVDLTCASCHRPAPDGGRMLPVTYEDHCAACHLLRFDTEGRLPATVTVPHGDPNAALSRLVELYAGAAVADPDASDRFDPVARALASQRARAPRMERNAHTPLSQPPGSEPAYVVERVALAVQVLERQTCAYCHGRADAAPESIPTQPASAPVDRPSTLPPAPRVPATCVPEAWMQRAWFSHRAHRALGCGACHGSAATSHDSSDVLLPGKQVCASCHAGPGADLSAPSKCVACHRYHPSDAGTAAAAVGPSRGSSHDPGSHVRGG